MQLLYTHYLKVYIGMMLALGITTAGICQNTAIDSLSQRLESSETDTARFRVMLDLSSEYRQVNPEKARQYTSKALSLARKMSDSVRIGKALSQQAVNHALQNNYNASNQHFDQALQIFQKLDQKSLIAQTLNNKGFNHINTGSYDQAREVFERALHYYRQDSAQTGNTEGLAFTYGRLGTLNSKQGKHRLALKQHQKALSLYDKKENVPFITSQLQNIAGDYMDLGLHDSSRVYYQKALDRLHQVQDSVNISVALNNLAQLHIEQNNSRQALDYVQRALRISQSLNIPARTAHSYELIGGIHKDIGHPDSALHYYRKSLSILRELGEKGNMADLLNQIGQLHLSQGSPGRAEQYITEALDMNEQLQDRQLATEIFISSAELHQQRGRFREALKYLQQAIPLAEQIHGLALLKKAYQLRAQILQEDGNYEQALEAHKKFQQYDDSLFNRQKNQTIAQLEARYQLQQKERENRLLREQKQRQRAELTARTYWNYLLIGSLSFVLLIAGLLWWYWRHQKDITQKLQKKNKQIAQQSRQLSERNQKLQEMDTFKTQMMQMIVHDLKNPLMAVIQLSDNKLVRQSGERMLRMVKNILEVEKLENAEIEAKTESIEINAIVQDVSNQLDPLLSVNEQQIDIKLDHLFAAKGDRHLTYRVIENLLSNAMKFSPGESSINVSAQKNDGMIRVAITDQGPGISKEEQPYIFNQFWSVQQTGNQNMSISAGLGLAFCKMAVEQQKGDIGVESNPKEEPGSTFWFTLPQDDQMA